MASQGSPSPPERQRQIQEKIQRAQQLQQQAHQALSRGQRDLAVRDFNRAVEDYTEVLRLDPQHLTAVLYRARAYESLGEDDKAEQDLARARELESP